MTAGRPRPDGLAALAAAVRRGERSAADIAATYLGRIESAGASINAFTAPPDGTALTAAAAVDAAVAAGADPGPLAGIPVAIKDIIDEAGVPNTRGTSFAPPVPETSAPVVDRLDAAGAVRFGRTVLHEFAFGYSSENHWFGPVRNPWDTATSCGGSSGGSAAAVAAGFAPAALGTDTGGSVRVPAAMCGIVGLKVTHGRIPITGVYPLGPSLDTVGPLTRSVDDAASLYLALAGHHPGDIWSRNVPVTAPGTPPPAGDIRLGIPHPWVETPLDGAVAEGWAWFHDRCRKLGIEVVSLHLPEIDFPGRVLESIYPEVAEIHRERFAAHPEGYGPEVRRRVEAAMGYTMAHYLEGLAWRNRIGDALSRALRDCDAVVTPTVPTIRKVIGEDSVALGGEDFHYRAALSRFAALVNHAGVPALSLPLAIDGAPPPSVQLIGPMWGEHRLLELGGLLEAEGVAGARPPAGFDW